MDVIIVSKILGFGGLVLDMVGAYILFKYSHPVALRQNENGEVVTDLYPVEERNMPDSDDGEVPPKLKPVWRGFKRIRTVSDYSEKNRLGIFLLLVGFSLQAMASIFQFFV